MKSFALQLKELKSLGYRSDMSSRKSNWLGLPPQTVTTGLLAFLKQVLLNEWRETREA